MKTATIKYAALAAVLCGALQSSADAQNFAAMRRAADATDFPPASTTLQAVMVSNDNWTTTADAGIYAIEARPGGKVTPVHKSEAMINTASALVRNNTMYAVEATQEGRFYYVQYSTSTWSASSRQEIDMQNCPADLTWDPVTGKAYGSFWSDDYMGLSLFGSYSLTSAEATYIDKQQRDERDIFTLAADGKGKIYALFGAFNYLATIDPITGQAERIKTTGLHPGFNLMQGRISSMVYDEANDRLLVALCEEEKRNVFTSSLYEIDPHTAAVTKLYDFEGNACFAGLTVDDARVAENAPGAPRNLEVVFGDSPYTGAVTFTAPSQTMAGSPLTGSVKALVSVGAQSKVVAVQPGEAVSVDGFEFVNGNNTVKVIMGNDTDRGGSAETTVWAGEDVPAAPTRLTLDVVDGTPMLTWTAPAAGVNGGKLVPANLRYTITRFPDKKVVATDIAETSFSDKTADPTWKALYYQVVCKNGAGTSEAATSNKMPAAGACPVPFTELFDTADDFAVWTTVNANGDTGVWGFRDKAAVYDYQNSTTPADDWLISPPIAVKSGQYYKVAYDYRAYDKSYPEAFELYVGDSADTAAFTQLLDKHENIATTTYTRGEAVFTANADKSIYLAWHCNSKAKMWRLYIDNIAVDVIDSRVPAAIADLTVTPAAMGAMKATVALTAPSKDADGNDLSALSKIVITRNDKEAPVKTFDAPQPGAALSFEDTDITAAGTYTYTAVAYTEVGSGVPASASAYVGVDAPGAVQNLTITGSHYQRQPILKWEAPTTGMNGGWFNPEGITYRIVRSDGTLVAEGLTELTFTDHSYVYPAQQEPLWYLVTPYQGTLKGQYATTSDIFLAGDPYYPDKNETFPDCEMVYYPWLTKTDNAVNAAWTLDPSGQTPPAQDYNGDRGLATFHSVGELPGVVSDFISPKFSLPSVGCECYPVVSFAMYHSPSIPGDAKLEVLKWSEQEGDFVPMGDVFKRADGETDGWVRHSVMVNSLEENDRIMFRGTADGLADIYIDDISINYQWANQMNFTSSSFPAKVAAGQSFECTGKLINTGYYGMNDIVVNLIIDEDYFNPTQTMTIAKLEPNESADVCFTVALDAVGKHNVLIQAQMDRTSAYANRDIDVCTPVIPKPANLEAAVTDNGVALTWQAPEENGSITDDVEAYSNWAIKNVGLWTMFDGDYDYTYAINNGVEYDNANDRKAFQVLNVKRLGIDIWDEGQAHSGNRLFAAMACINTDNNDWLISPQLNGAEQWISFYARAFTMQIDGAEKMRVLYSTTNADPTSFTAITDAPVVLDGTWRRYRYYLPEGARYFAINCVSSDGFAMFVDDISFNDMTVVSRPVTGYEVKRQDKVIATVTEAAYTDAEPLDGKATYAVRALYEGAEPSAWSDAVDVDNSGIATVGTTEAVPTATYNAAGIVVSGDLTPGIYLVRYSDGTVRKLTVK